MLNDQILRIFRGKNFSIPLKAEKKIFIKFSPRSDALSLLDFFCIVCYVLGAQCLSHTPPLPGEGNVPSASSSRSGIKQYFLDTYGLTLSVRPPHLKRYVKGKPVICVRAQILLGKHVFSMFSKDDVKRYMEGVSVCAGLSGAF